MSLNSLLKTRYSVLLLLLAYLAVGSLFAIFTPAWQAPDEPAHYNYVAQVARNGCCPVIEVGDWNSPYLEQLKANRFVPNMLADLPTIQYEDHQPPLYYLLQSLVFRLTNGSLIALRLVSVLLGAGIVACAYVLGRAALPQRPQVALAGAALVAFLPQHVAILASVNNDALGNLIIALTLLATVRYLQFDTTNSPPPSVVRKGLVTQPSESDDQNGVFVGRRHASSARYFQLVDVIGEVKEWHLGVLVGIGLLTKVTTIFLVGLVPLVIIWKNRHSARGTRYSVLMTLLKFAIPVLLLAGLWWLHSLNTYGFPDVFGLRQHDRVVTDQARTADLIAQIGFPAYLSRAVETTYNSFWGQFGWMGVPMPGWIYQAIFALLLLCASGLIVGAGSAKRPTRLQPATTPSPNNRPVWLLLTLTIFIALLQYIYYNTVFLQLQGRYMFTSLVPFALFMALGLEGWRGWLARRFAWLHPYLIVLPFALFALLDLYLLWRVIVPALAP